MFYLLENKLWAYDEETKKFSDPKTKINYDQSVFKQFILFNNYDKRFIYFLLDQFETKMSIEFIEALLEKDKYILTKYFVSFVGPIKEYYPNENIPMLEDIPHKIHPQIEEMRNIYYRREHEDLFEHSNLKVILKALNLSISYNLNQFQNIYYDKYKISNNLLNINRSNVHRETIISLNEKGNELLHNLNIDDAWKVIDYIKGFYELSELKDILKYYIEKLLDTEKQESLKNSIKIYLKYWKINKDELVKSLFKTNKQEYITMFIEEFELFPDNKDNLNKYNKDNQDVVYLLMNKISKLENKINLLESKLDDAIKNKLFNKSNYND